MGEWQELDSPSGLGVSRDGAAVRIEFRRPDVLNAMDGDTSIALRDLVRSLGEDDSVRAVLLTGQGRAFCAGADIAERFTDPDSRAQIERGLHEVTTPTILALRTMPKPVIAAVNGPAAGIGCSLALASDIVLAAESAYFLLAFANIGLTTDGGASLIVAARAGLGRAMVMGLLAERVPARDALAWGLADRVVDDADLPGVADELVLRLAGGPTRSYAATKEAVNRAVLGGLPDALATEARLQGDMSRTADFAEGADAFLGTRRPDFSGR
jgi:2-(1,2-epoxy-1,2-dihydrophenyl)acetyl-CoA isomerase